MVYILMGVSGCGKSTVGEKLAKSLGIAFQDGDSFHPQANLEKMAGGKALNDKDRRPWLQSLAEHILQWNKGSGAVLACSALKEKYRAILSQYGGVIFIFLKGPRALIAKRMKERDHFMPLSLLDSQFSELEIPEDAWAFSIEAPIEHIVCMIKEKIHAHFD